MKSELLKTECCKMQGCYVIHEILEGIYHLTLDSTPV